MGNGRRNAFSVLIPSSCSSAPDADYKNPWGRNHTLIWPSNPLFLPTIFTPAGDTSTFDTAGRLLKEVDKRGRATYLAYDSYGHLTKIVSPHGRVVTLAYEDIAIPNNITKITDPDGKITRFGYNLNGNLAQITDPLDKVLDYAYDSAHRMTRETLKNLTTYYASYEAAPGEFYAHSIRDGQSNIIARVSATLLPQNRQTVMPPEDIAMMDGCGNTLVIHRDSFGRITYKSWINGATQRVLYGVFGGGGNRVIGRIDEMDDSVSTGWWDNGYVWTRTDALQYTTVFNRDHYYKDLVTLRIEPGNRVWRYTYSDNTNLGDLTDVRGDLLRIEDPIHESPTDKVTTFAYETHPANDGVPYVPLITSLTLPGRIKKITETDRNGHVTIREYNHKGNLVTLTRGAGSGSGTLNLVTTYEYDNMGRRKKETIQRPNEAPVVTQWTYDAMGRVLTTREDPDGLNLTTTRFYDNQGNLDWMKDPKNIITDFTYDHRNRLKTKTEAWYTPAAATTEWEFDCNGNVHVVTDPINQDTTYDYNLQNQLSRIIDAEGYHTKFTRDLAGRLRLAERFLNAGAPGMATPAYRVRYSYDGLNRMILKRVDPDGLNLQTTVEYAPSGSCSCNPATPGGSLPYKITDPKGKVTFFGYDLVDRLTRVVRKVGDQQTAPEGDSDDAITAYEYDAEGNVKKATGPEGERTDYEFDAADRTTNKKVFHTTSASLDTEYGYDAADNLRALTLPNGNTQTLTYDGANRVLMVNDSVGYLAMYSYDANGNMIREAAGSGHTTRREFDAANRVTKIYDPVIESPDRYTEFEYDPAGNRTRVIDNNGVKTTYLYDHLNRIIGKYEDNLGMGPTGNTHTAYGWNGMQQWQVQDHDGNVTTYYYDAALRLSQATYPSPGGQVSYYYDAAGNLTDRVDQRHIMAAPWVTTYAHDDLHHLSSRHYTEGEIYGPTEYFTFDRSGRLKAANNSVLNASFTYDLAGRPVTAAQQFVSDMVSYPLTYDYTVATTSSRTATYPGQREVKHYFDARMRLQEVSGGTGVGVNWSHDLANRREDAVLANGILSTFAYDDDDRLLGIDDALDSQNLYEIDYAYDPAGNRKSTRLAIQQMGGPTSDRSEAYQYDPLNRLTTMDRGELNAPGTAVATPLQDAILANKQEWTNLDRRGNWLDYQETIGSAATRRLSEVDAMNEYTCIAPNAPVNAELCTTQPSVTPDYDDAGNMTLDPLARVIGDGTSASGQKYEYDDEMRVKAIRRASDDKMLLEFTYDAIGRRAETIEHIDPQSGTLWDGQSGHPSPRHTRHVYDGLQTVEEYVCCEGGSCGSNPPSCGNGWALVREFVWGGRFPEPIAMVDHTDAGVQSAGVAEVFHYLHDALGSIIGLTNGAGTVFERYTYDPYGRTLAESRHPATGSFGPNLVNGNFPTFSALGNPFMWTGQRYDAETGTYQFLYRTFSAVLGRWLQRDFVGYEGGSINLYEYVQSAPVTFVDPLGLEGVHPLRPIRDPIRELREKLRDPNEKIAEEAGMPWTNPPANPLLRADWCLQLAEYIKNLKASIERRIRDLEENPRNLPWDTGCGKPGADQKGHLRLEPIPVGPSRDR